MSFLVCDPALLLRMESLLFFIGLVLNEVFDTHKYDWYLSIKMRELLAGLVSQVTSVAFWSCAEPDSNGLCSRWPLRIFVLRSVLQVYVRVSPDPTLICPIFVQS